MKKNTQRGFTLMELLVVIAIIGILASVVLASLNTARQKGSDAAIKASLNNARAQAELYYDNHTNSYSGVCDAADGIDPMLDAADAQNGSPVVDCDSSSTAWAAESVLVSPSPTQYYCVDSTGASQTDITPKAASATAC